MEKHCTVVQSQNSVTVLRRKEWSSTVNTSQSSVHRYSFEVEEMEIHWKLYHGASLFPTVLRWKEWRSTADLSQSFAYHYSFEVEGME